jgi:hypothetical protein
VLRCELQDKETGYLDNTYSIILYEFTQIESRDSSYSLLPLGDASLHALNVAVKAQADWVCHDASVWDDPCQCKGIKKLSRPSLMNVLLMGRVHNQLHQVGRSGYCESSIGIRARRTYSRGPDRVHAVVTSTS